MIKKYFSRNAPKYIKNSFYLFLIQISGYLVPIFEISILSDALGPEKYGHVLFAFSLSIIGAVFIEYGFIFYATKLASLHRSNKSKLRSLYSNVMLAKILIAIVVTVIMILIWKFTDLINIKLDLLWLIILLMLATGLSSQWYFQGKESILLVSILGILIRFSMLLGLHLFIHSPEDYFLAFEIQVLSFLIIFLIHTFLILKEIGIEVPSFYESIKTLKESYHSFLYWGAQNIGNSLYTAILAVLTTPYHVGIFAPVEKLTRAGVGFINPIAMASFPHMVNIKKSGNRRTGIKLLILSTAISLFGATVGFILSEKIVHVIFSNEFTESILILKILIWVVPLKVFSQYISILFLIPNDKERVSSNSLLVTLILTVLLSILFLPKYGLEGLVYSVLGVESLQALFLSRYIFK